MNIIVTVDENWAIGKGEGQLVQIPGDQRNFQNLTKGGVVVMGRKTLQGMPQGQPLYGRDHLILSENPDFKVKGAQVFASLEALLQEAESRLDEEIFVCGGESVYKQLLPYCDTAYVTMIEKAYDANRYFLNLDKEEAWELTEESDEQTCFDITYYFRKYQRKK